MIVDGDLDYVSEKHFMYKGTIDEVVASFEKEKAEAK